MPGRELLLRFRPAGAPGGAAGVGVPVDAEHTAPSELAPVLAALAPTLAACARIRDEASAAAARMVADADAQVRAVESQAELDAAAARAAAAADVRRRTDDATRRTIAAARAQADEVLRVGLTRVPSLIDEVLAELSEDLCRAGHALPAPDPALPDGTTAPGDPPSHGPGPA